MTIPKIMIVGKMRSGKSTMAQHLRLNYGFEEVSFGTSLKYYAQKIFAEDFFTSGKPRAVYQQFGQLCREIDSNVWIRHAEQFVQLYAERRSTEGIVISDGRQPDEIAWGRANGFTIVRVTASDDVRIARAQARGDVFTYEDLTHPTEQYIDGFEVDYTLTNDGSYDDLIAEAERFMAEITAKGAIECPK
ncbi:AAA family ATPase [Psychrobacillus sp. OK032]|uniref:AAA family ATPase n=1 Tax=Psychrobacillus sp. OK032 TaxID=1884358 RepID=UPI0008C30194|nr:AAA family ATPase [Psychrobacillus sp. OK032]SER87734.1 cytidine deaminase [Psychrobacillus sp. OK032]